MFESRWWVVTVVGLLGLGCADDDDHDDALVRGQVVRIVAATSYTEAVALGSDSVARISLYASTVVDAPATLRAEQVFSPAKDVDPPAHDVVIEVRGQESCGAPNADERCLDL